MKKRTQMGRVAGRPLLASLLVLGALALVGPPSPAPGLPGRAGAEAHHRCWHSGARPARVNLRHLRIWTRCLINRARARHRLHPLRVNRKLRRVATGHSNAMVRHGFFAHGATQARIAHTGYFHAATAWAYGEVIGFGCHRDGSAKAVFSRWMRSPPHRQDILTGRFREIGVGVSRRDPDGDGRRCATYTVDLGVTH